LLCIEIEHLLKILVISQNGAADFYSECGITKDCFGSPFECVATKSCQAISSTSVKNGKMVFELLSGHGNFFATWLVQN
jgi:hypothetical protein